MNIKVVGKDLEVTDAIRDYSEKKMEKLTKYLEDFDGTVTIKVEGNKQIAETRVSYQGITYKAVTAHKDLYASIDKNIDILEGQIRKTKTKRERLNKEATIRASQEEEQTEPENEIIKELYYEIIGNMPIDINTICRRAELPIQDVSEQLTMLELNEYIRALPGDMFVKV